MKNGRKVDCGSGESIVAYIYDEATPSERRRFEAHLLECSECTDEFAELSNARFSVFEWQKESFADLPTPEIVIPYKTSPAANADAGLWAAVQNYLGGFAVPALAAAVLLAVGIGFAAIVLSRGDQQQLATNTVPPPVSIPQNVAVPASDEVPNVVEKPDLAYDPESNDIDSERQKVVPARRAARVATQTKAVRSPTPRQVVARSEQKKTPETPSKKPVLSEFEETDDRSLRLTDLFDEIGSGGR